MPKDLESLKKSRDMRSAIQAKYGCIPTSIMTIEKNKKAQDCDAETFSYYSTTNVQTNTVGKTIFDVSGQSVRGGALSRYPQNIGRYLVKMYSEEGETILDPFAGHNSRMELVHKLARNYIGYDISRRFMESNRSFKDELCGKNQLQLFQIGGSITLIEDDARNIEVDMPVDMILTSPPYWDLEYYGDEPAQLGKARTYDIFLCSIKAVLSRCLATLKPKRFCCWSVNDFRKDGNFYTYHSDIISIYKEVGFKLHDIIIVDLGSPIGAAFASQLEEQKRTAKRHEYVIIGQK